MAEYSEQLSTELGFWVYRLWSADGTCLYVGCTGERGPRRLSYRLGQHKRLKPWWPEVARIDAARFANAAEIIAEEPAQIAVLNPVHNKHLRRYCRLRGHDLSLPGARGQEGRCNECYREWQQQREPKLRNAARVRRYRKTPAGQAHLVTYERSRAVRKAQQKLSRTRRPSLGQEPLW